MNSSAFQICRWCLRRVPDRLRLGGLTYCPMRKACVEKQARQNVSALLKLVGAANPLATRRDLIDMLLTEVAR